MTDAINNFVYITGKMNEARYTAKYATKAANTTASSAHPLIKTTPLVDDCSL